MISTYKYIYFSKSFKEFPLQKKQGTTVYKNNFVC